MRTILLTLLIFLSCANLYAQDKKESENTKPQYTLGDDCGDPSVESQLYVSRKGKITKIISANKVLFEQIIANGNERKENFTVELVGIDSTRNEKNIKQFLEKYILNQNVEVIGNL